jgi:hypothetical protein
MAGESYSIVNGMTGEPLSDLESDDRCGGIDRLCATKLDSVATAEEEHP